MPNKVKYIKNVTINVWITYNCSCPNTNISTWTVEEIDQQTGEKIRTVNLYKNPTVKTPDLFIRNGTLKYGLYRFTFNFTIVTNDETAPPFTSIIIEYIKIIPTGFTISGFEIREGDPPKKLVVVSPTDTVAFIPAYFSYDVDRLSDSKQLFYNFYCILVDENYDTLYSNVTLNFTTSLYKINPDQPLTADQLDAEDTCFKTEDLYYFDVSGKGWSLPNGMQYAYDGKNYKIQITAYVPLADTTVSTTYTVQVVMPQGTNPLVTVG